MTRFQPGDVLTFPLRGDIYGVAKIIHVEDLALHDNYHLEVFDMLVEGAEEIIDEFGQHSRIHDVEIPVDTPIAVDHVALTEEALLASAPVKIAEHPLDERELIGYHVWVQMRYQEAVRQGLIRERNDEPEDVDEFEVVDDDEAYDEEAFEEGEEAVESEDDEATLEEAEAVGAAGEGEEEPPATRTVTVDVKRWHRVTFEIPVDKMLFENYDEIAAPQGRESSRLEEYLSSHFNEGNVEAINDLVARFLSGDYGAGHELLDFGAPAATALASTLAGEVDPELADDILRILTEMGIDPGYQQVVEFLERHGDLDNDPLALPAARNYCYAVMITGGDPPPLRPYLERLETWDHPELEDDLRLARQAVAETPRTEPEGPSTGQSSDPFGL